LRHTTGAALHFDAEHNVVRQGEQRLRLHRDNPEVTLKLRPDTYVLTTSTENQLPSTSIHVFRAGQNEIVRVEASQAALPNPDDNAGHTVTHVAVSGLPAQIDVANQRLSFRDLSSLPIQTCWPEDAGPLITWGLVVTRGPEKARQNLGIYRMQVIGRNKVIMRWLAHRGGALDYRDWQGQYPDKPFPISVALGADPATILAAVTPVPDSLSEYAFAGLLRGSRTEVTRSIGNELQVPASAEFVLEGHLHPGEMAAEGPFGDHTGYYNEVDRFPVFTIDRITHRRNPIYHSTYTGRPPDEPAILGVALNEVLVPILQKQFPEITDFYLPPEGCSYRMAVVSMKKQYPGHAKRVLFGIWSFLRQFMYTKFVIVTDDDVNVRDWNDVIWAMTTRMDPARDTIIVENTPIDYLDFASPVSGLGGKVGFDATNKWPGETQREWGRPISMSQEVKQRVDAIWDDLGLV